MDDSRIDINLADSPGLFIQELDDNIGIDVVFDDHIEVDIFATERLADHGGLQGLTDDDHTQYYNQARGDARYERYLGLPAANDYVLYGRTDGTRYWGVPTGEGGTGSVYHNLLLGIQGGATDDYYHLPANLYNAFEYVPNGGNPYLRVKLPIACDGDVQAFSDTGWLPPDIWAAMPYATNSSIGGIQFTTASPAAKYLREDGAWVVPPVGSGSGMVYPGEGIARSTGAAWAASLTDNSVGWNAASVWVAANGANAVTAYGWGNHASAGYLTAINKALVEAVLTGSITSHNHPTVNTANYSIVQESGKLVIKYGATAIASFSSAGLLTVADDVEAFGTP